MTRHVLAVRLDSCGDVLLMGPALRALAAGSDRLDLLVSPEGQAAGRLLPGVDDLIVFEPPWSGVAPPQVDPSAVAALVQNLRDRRYDDAVIFTSYHQSPLPMALLARMAGIGRVAATSEDYPGTLLDVRHRRVTDASGGPLLDTGGATGGHEVEAALSLAEAAGFPLPTGDDRRLRVHLGGGPGRNRRVGGAPLPALPRPYVVLNPRASVPARSIGDVQTAAVVRALRADGWHVVLTGTEGAAPGTDAIDLVGRTSFAQLATVLRGAECVVSVNTATAHLAAAVGVPVVSLFAPVVPAARWRPWGVPTVVLGDQEAPCRATRSRTCPAPGHPCLSTVEATDVADSVTALLGVRGARQEPA